MACTKSEITVGPLIKVISHKIIGTPAVILKSVVSIDHQNPLIKISGHPGLQKSKIIRGFKADAFGRSHSSGKGITVNSAPVNCRRLPSPETLDQQDAFAV